MKKTDQYLLKMTPSLTQIIDQAFSKYLQKTGAYITKAEYIRKILEEYCKKEIAMLNKDDPQFREEKLTKLIDRNQKTIHNKNKLQWQQSILFELTKEELQRLNDIFSDYQIDQEHDNHNEPFLTFSEKSV